MTYTGLVVELGRWLPAVMVLHGYTVPRYVAIHIHTSWSHDAIGPNNETCDILLPNGLKNAKHLGLTVLLPVATVKSNYQYRLRPTAVHSGRTMYNFSILNGRCCLERRQCESSNEVKSNKM